MRDKDMEKNKDMVRLSEDEEKMVAGGYVDYKLHRCEKCNRSTMQYAVKNGYVCSVCKTLN